MKREYEKIDRDRDMRIFKSEEFTVIECPYDHKKPEIFIKFSSENHFTEIAGGFNTVHGNNKMGNGKNPWNSHRNSFEFFIKGEDMFIKENSFDCHFLKLVAQKSKNKMTNEICIEEILQCDYLKLPSDIMEIQSVHKLSDTFFILCYPKYNFRYETHVL